jgi:hypothetical protein
MLRRFLRLGRGGPPTQSGEGHLLLEINGNPFAAQLRSA